MYFLTLGMNRSKQNQQHSVFQQRWSCSLFLLSVIFIATKNEQKLEAINTS